MPRDSTTLGSCPRPLLASIAAVFVLVFLAEAVPAAGQTGEILTRQYSQAQEWAVVETGGSTSCAVDRDYRFFTRTASPDSLVIFLWGGGGCWSAELCVPEAEGVYISEISESPARSDGIFDLDNAENPVSGYSMVAVPYCTGDVHLGNRDATYTLEREGQAPRTYTIHHRGLANVEAALDWAYEHFRSPDQILVTGISAGGLGTPFHAERVARHYPEARVIGLGDGAGAYRAEAMPDLDASRWGAPDVLQRYPGWEELAGVTTEELFETAAQGAPNLELYQFDQAYDAAQQSYLALAGSPGADPLHLLRLNRRDIRAVDPAFRSFTVGGYAHTTMIYPRLYYYEIGNRSFRGWLADLLAGKPVESHWCGDCRRPDYDFSAADLAVLDRALELLSREQDWDPDHEGQCPGARSPLSLQCAIWTAVAEQGHALLDLPAPSEVVYEALERLGGEEHVDAPLERFNNRSATGFADVRGLLIDVRERVATEIEEEG